MSLATELIEEIQHNTKKKPSRQRSRFNAVKHNLSGNNLILLESERVAYNRMAVAMLNDINPKTEPERQIAQKIIDTNFRLNRITAIESNMFTFGLFENERENECDDQIETMAAQTRAWIERGNSFDLLGRYETRLSRQLLKYQQEFERLQAERKKQELIDKSRSAEEIKRDAFDPASFGKLPPEFYEGPGTYRAMTPLLPVSELQTIDVAV